MAPKNQNDDACMTEGRAASARLSVDESPFREVCRNSHSIVVVHPIQLNAKEE